MLTVKIWGSLGSFSDSGRKKTKSGISITQLLIVQSLTYLPIIKCFWRWEISRNCRKIADSVKILKSHMTPNYGQWPAIKRSLLSAKLAAYGFHLSACKLIASYLYNRQQCVFISGKRSAWSDVVKGVPQGLILGPLLFDIFIKWHIPLWYVLFYYNYAGDNCISYSP